MAITRRTSPQVNPLKIYTLVTESHKPLLNDWFLKTLPSDCEPVASYMHADPTKFREGHWHDIFAQKIRMVLGAIAQNHGSLIAVSDVDVQFFRPIAADLQNRTSGFDIMFQNNACGRSTSVTDLCAGFMVVRCSERVKPFFEEAYQRLIAVNHPATDDQVVYADILSQFKDLKIGLLPNNYWTNAKLWVRGDVINPPRDIMIHHANWTHGVECKIDQLRCVREILNSSSSI